MLATIREVAEAGFAFSPSRQFSGVEAISYPIVDRHRRAIAALTVPYVTRLDDNTRMSAAATQSVLAKVAAELNDALGGTITMPGPIRLSVAPARSRRQFVDRR